MLQSQFLFYKYNFKAKSGNNAELHYLSCILEIQEFNKFSELNVGYPFPLDFEKFWQKMTYCRGK